MYHMNPYDILVKSEFSALKELDHRRVSCSFDVGCTKNCSHFNMCHALGPTLAYLNGEDMARC